MLLLVEDVVPHPGQLLLPEADDAEASLPLEHLIPNLMVDLVRARPLEVPDEIADAHRGFDVDGKMDVVLRAAHLVKEHSLRAEAAVAQELVDQRLDAGR